MILLVASLLILAQPAPIDYAMLYRECAAASQDEAIIAYLAERPEMDLELRRRWISIQKNLDTYAFDEKQVKSAQQQQGRALALVATGDEALGRAGSAMMNSAISPAQWQMQAERSIEAAGDDVLALTAAYRRISLELARAKERVPPADSPRPSPSRGRRLR